jgi:Fur family iron response transcriptional regulator|tara:strand:- start:51 stop:476 length:426 start_codon:yes stop_codon:yes gene_type:complete
MSKMSDNTEFVKKLRSVGLRPTKQRLKICKILFDRKNTFHFTISDLQKIIKTKIEEKVSLATIYNTVHSFKKKGYLKEISINSDKSYYDTNITNHHHFLDEETNELLDLDDNDISNLKIKKTIPGKKIKSIEVLVKIANNN